MIHRVYLYRLPESNANTISQSEQLEGDVWTAVSVYIVAMDLVVSNARSRIRVRIAHG
jgi:hypothetical protein